MKASKVLGAVALAGAGALAWGLLEAQAFTTRHRVARVLEPGTAPIRILHISDLHLTPGQTRKVEWVRSLAALRPDVLITTGDNLADANAEAAVMRALEPFRSTPGAFVFGSNDYFGPKAKNPFGYFGGPSKIRAEHQELPTESLREAFLGAGWVDLNNSRGKIKAAGRTIGLVGLDDPHLGRDEMPRPSRAKADLRIGVVHAPYQRALNALVDDGADVILAGHTHGGQVCLPGYGALVTNCDLPREMATGVHTWTHGKKQAELHVCAGLGTSPYAPVRVACAPEAVLLTLLPREA